MSHPTKPAVLAVAVAATLAGCSMFNPYEHFAVVPAIGTDAAGKREAMSLLGFHDAPTLAGGALEALSEVETMRWRYYRDMRGIAIARSTVTTVGVFASTWAVYNALTGASGTTLTASDHQRTGRLALTAGTAYTMGQYFVNPEQENIYAEGYNALTCLALQSRPLLMPAGSAGLAYEDFIAALNTLETKLGTLHEAVAQMAIGVARAGEAGARTSPGHNATAKDLGDARAALKRARETLSDGHALKDQLDKAGYSIRARAGLISGAINSQLRDKQAAFKDVRAVLDEAKAITNAFKGLVEAPPPADDSDAAADDGDGGGATPVVSNGWGWMASWGTHIFASASAAVRVASTAPRAASAPKPAASAASAAKPAAAKPVAATKAELDAAITTLKTFIVDVDEQKRYLAKLQQDAKLQAKIDALEKEAKEAKAALAKKQELLDAKVGPCVPDAHGGAAAMCSRPQLAKDVEVLYAARRKVQFALNNFRNLALSVRTVAECNTNPAGLRVFPNEGRRVRQGDTLSFTVSEASGATPFVVLQGNAGTPPAGKESLKLEPLGTVARVTLSIGADAPEGWLVMVATDAKARHRETVRMLVEKAPEDKGRQAKIAAAVAATAKSAAEAAKAAAEAAALIAK